MTNIYRKLQEIFRKCAKYIFSALIVLFPLFVFYKSPIPKVSIVEFITFIFVILALVFDFKKYKIAGSIVPFFLVIIIHLISTCWLSESYMLMDSLFTGLRLLFLYFLLMFFTLEYFDYKVALRILVVTALLVSIYGIVQFICGLNKVYLYNYIPILPRIMNAGMDTYEEYVASAQAGYAYRICSIFREPAHFATYLLVPATLLLFKKETTVWSLIFGFLFIVVSFMTLSSLGIIVSALLVVTFLVFLLISKKYKWWHKLIVVGVLTIGITLFFVLGGWKFFATKTFGKDFELKNILTDSRLSVVALLLEKTIPQVIFGSGLAELGIYMSTFVRAAYCMGLIGLIALSITFALQYLKTRKRSLIVLLSAYLLICFGSEIAFGAFALVYLSFILIQKEERISLFKIFKL